MTGYSFIHLQTGVPAQSAAEMKRNCLCLASILEELGRSLQTEMIEYSDSDALLDPSSPAALID